MRQLRSPRLIYFRKSIENVEVVYRFIGQVVGEPDAGFAYKAFYLSEQLLYITSDRMGCGREGKNMKLAYDTLLGPVKGVLLQFLFWISLHAGMGTSSACGRLSYKQKGNSIFLNLGSKKSNIASKIANIGLGSRIYLIW